MRRLSPYAALLLSLVVAAALVRLAAATGDLWFDEIWSLLRARELDGPAGVFTAIHHDNNHYLTTLYLYVLHAIGEPRSFVGYRLLSLVSGIAAVALIALIARRRGRIEAIVAVLLAGSSFPLILYASEARGYAGAVACGLAAYVFAGRFLRGGRVTDAAWVWLWTSLGLLSHLTFLFVLVPMLVWSGIVLLRSESRTTDALRRTAIVWGVPIAVLALLYAVDIRHLRAGGGPPESLFEVMLLTYSHATLLPRFGIARLSAFLSLAIGIGATLAAIFDMWRKQDLDWIFFAGVLGFAPLVAAAASQSESAPPVTLRYFLVGLPFLMLAVSYTLSDWMRASRPQAILAVAVVVASMTTNSSLTRQLLDHGRGGYSDALAVIAGESSSGRVLVSSNNDVRNGTLIRLYAERRGNAPPRIVYMPRNQAATRAPDWYITHSFMRGYRPAARLQLANRPFELVGRFPAGPFSGWPWYLYKRAPAEINAD